MIGEAVAFAAKAHEGQFRKGTSVPYITHPLEAAVIVAAITDDEELISAAALHDVIEDAGVKYEELKERFGLRVADLVRSESEDKSRTWEERKTTAIRNVGRAGHDVKILTLADKLSNMRSTAKDYLLIGDRIWNRFNEKHKERQADYYLGMAEALKDLSGLSYYAEYLDLCGLVFGKCGNGPELSGRERNERTL